MTYVIVGIVVLGLVAYYLFYMKKGGGAGYYEREFGLQEGEEVQHIFGGGTIPKSSLAREVAEGALMLMEGEVGKTGRGRPLNAAMTSHNRLILRIERDEPIAFGPDPRPRMKVGGETDEEMRGKQGMEPGKVLGLKQEGGEPVRICLPASAVAMITEWVEGKDFPPP